MKDYLKKKFKYWWTLSYAIFYLIGFYIVEHIDAGKTTHILTTSFDHAFPFNEWFIIFYYMWFPFIGFTFVYLFFRDKRDYLRMITVLYTGMTIFLIISYIYPNGLDLRVQVPNRNIACVLTNALYTMDTPTNVFPSIHVYNSIGMTMALWKTDTNKGVKIGSTILCIMIILSTLFLKQHSIADILSAGVLMIIMYIVVYHYDWYFLKRKTPVKRNEC